MSGALAGIFPAVWTPTDADGRLLTSALEANLKFLKQAGVHGFMSLGSTGEFPLLEVKMRQQVLETTLACADGLPVVANISDVRPKVVQDLGRFARQAGARAVAVLPPGFFKVAQSDLVEFFVRAAEASELPVVLYNFPERVGMRIELETVAAVADRVPVVGFKQSGDEFGYHEPVVKLGREKGFVVFTGADTRLAEALGLGARGAITGMANAVPELMVEIFSACNAGTPEKAGLATERMKWLGPIIDSLWFPLNISALMKARGLEVGVPKEVVSRESMTCHDELVNRFAAVFREWRLI